MELMLGRTWRWAGLALLTACTTGAPSTASPDLLAPPQAPDLASPDLASPPDLTPQPDLTAPSCSDGIKNGGETDVDCGAGCARCGDGKSCVGASDCTSGVCVAGVCRAASCQDLVKNGAETDVDCGGGCAPCAVGKACALAIDCASAVCAGGACASATCADGVRNGGETATDCGGSCPPCADGLACAIAADCASGVCSAGSCRAPTCSDRVKNGAESDVDCGGGCGPCLDGKACGSGADCASRVCMDVGGGARACVAAVCSDGVKNGSESDVDCGGGACPACADGKTCGDAPDCASKVCKSGSCVAPACDDGVKNGGEADIDCGGPCATGCATGKACGVGADCASRVCTAGACVAASCSDGVKNAAETDVDCGGGACTPCGVGKACGGVADCSGNAVCAGGKCACATGAYGATCTTARTCKEVKAADATLVSGAYSILLNGSLTRVYCDMTSDGGGWTLVGYVSSAGPNQSCVVTGARNFYSLATGGGTYDAVSRSGAAASLPSVPIARLSTEILLARSDTNGYAGDIAGATVATKFRLPNPATVNFLNGNPNSSDDKGACTAVTLTTVVGPSATGQTRYTFANTISTTWGDTYPTSYGADNASNCSDVGSPVGPSFVSDYTGIGRAQGQYCWPFDTRGGAYTYWYVGWWDPTANSKGGAASIWLR